MSLLMQCFNLNRYPFMRYGPNVVEYYSLPSAERETFSVNPMCEAFPRIAACHYYRYGSGGRQETLDAICILGLNMINDKAILQIAEVSCQKVFRIIIFFHFQIFLVLWFWYAFLSVFGLARFVYRCMQMSSRRVRYSD